MKEIIVIFEDDTELAEFEAIGKGYRNDIYVTINRSTFNVIAYSMVRLQQDFESEINDYGFYSIEANLIIVKDTNKEEIIETIRKLYDQGLFEKLKPLKEEI